MVKTKLTDTIPPKRGPLSQGLKVPQKKIKLVRSEKLNGNNR